MADREECVYLAKLAEQAERYDEMVSLCGGCGRRGRSQDCYGNDLRERTIWPLFVPENT